MQRVKWTCPQCEKTYAVPSTDGLSLCPQCSGSNAKPRPVKPSTTTSTPFSFPVEPVVLRSPKKTTGRNVIIAISVFVGLLISGGLLFFVLSNGGKQDLTKLIPKRDPNKMLVEKWLKENLDDGKWEEVKWWPAVKSQALYDVNARRIIAKIEEVKSHFEQGIEIVWESGELVHGGENNAAFWKRYFESFEKIGPRTFCGMKYRTRNPLGGMVLRSQIYEISNDVVTPLVNNQIVEFPAYPGEVENEHNGLRSRVPVHDGWRFLDDRNFDPNPEMPPRNLGERLKAALIWKKPSNSESNSLPESVEIQESKVPLWQRQKPQPIQARVPDEGQPAAPGENPPAGEIVEAPHDKHGDIPSKIREYFERTDKTKKETISKLEKEIERAEIFLQGRTGDAKISARQNLSRLKKSLENTKKSIFVSYLSAPLAGDIGIFKSLTVSTVIDEKTLICMDNDYFNKVIISPIQTKDVKVGQQVLKGAFFRVSASFEEPSEIMKDKRINDYVSKSRPIRFVAEPLKKQEIEKYRDQYEREKNGLKK